MATRFGLIKKTALDEFANLRKAGLIAIVLREDDELIGVELTSDDDELMLATRQGQAIRFKETDILCDGPQLHGVKSFDLSETTRSHLLRASRRQAGARHHPEGLRQAHRRFRVPRAEPRRQGHHGPCA